MKREVLRDLLALIFIGGVISDASGLSSGQGPKIQYLFPDFSESVMLMKNGDKRSAVMNFNTVTEKLVFIKDNKYYDLMNPEMVDTVYLNDRKFIPAGKTFYEVLYKGPVSLFLQNKGELVEKGAPVGYGGTSQVAKSTSLSSYNASDGVYNLELPDKYTVRPAPVYWIRRGNDMLDFTTQKQFLSLFPDKSEDIKNFIRESRLKFTQTGDLVKIVKYCGKW